jgi:MFS family permease
LTTTLFFISPIAGALISRVGERPLIVGGLLLQAVGMAWIALIVEPHLPYVEMIASKATKLARRQPRAALSTESV